MKRTAFSSATILAGSLAIAFSSLSPAQAFTFSFGSTSQSSNTPATGASATVDFSFESIASNAIKLTLGIQNTTGQTTFGSGATASKLTGIAFDLLPGLSASNFAGDQYFDTLLTNVDFNPFSNSVGNFSIGIADNNNFEGGNANAALPQGSTSTVSLVLTGFAPGTTASKLESDFFKAFTTAGDGVDIAARFQQVNAGAGSDKLLGGTGSNGGGGDDGGEPPTSVPEPGMVAGLSLIAGIFVSKRRQKEKALS